MRLARIMDNAPMFPSFLCWVHDRTSTTPKTFFRLTLASVGRRGVWRTEKKWGDFLQRTDDVCYNEDTVFYLPKNQVYFLSDLPQPSEPPKVITKIKKEVVTKIKTVRKLKIVYHVIVRAEKWPKMPVYQHKDFSADRTKIREYDREYRRRKRAEARAKQPLNRD